MRSVLIAVTVFCCLAVAPAGFAQTGNQQLTAEQQQMIDMLPAAQRAEVLRQIRQAQQQRQLQRRPDERERPDRPERRPDVDEDVDDVLDVREIRPDDTLLIEIRRPLLEDAARDRDRDLEEHLLEGRHTVQLDRFGRLNMPGLTNIPLAGLNDEQASMRLMAERLLQDMVVFVTRLPLKPTGRDALHPFGYTIFQRHVETLRPLASQAVPSDYVVGPGDTVQVQFFGREFTQHQLTVSRDGMLHVPNIGPVAVAGRRFSEMKSDLEQRIEEQTIGTRGAVSMGELRSIEVFVLGDVARPGAFTVSSLATVLHALYASGGITQIGSLRDVRVLRGGEVVRRFDLYELLLHGNARDDVRLESDDVVFVPATGPRAGVIGEVRRPAWYELKDGTTFGDLIEYAGGAARDADLTRARVERVRGDGYPQHIDLDGTAAAGRRTQAQDGDVLAIPRVTRTATDAVTLHGHFALTGARQWRDGLRIADVITDRSALRDNADLDYALVVRELDDGRGVTIRSFSPRRVLADQGSADNLELHARDEIITFSFDDTTARRALLDPLIERLRRQATQDAGLRVVRVVGAVRAAGHYPLSDGMRVSDLVRAGGGLAESAFLEDAEITRFHSTARAERATEHVRLVLQQALDGDDDPLLQSSDVLNVKHLPQWAEHGTIELRGEVRFPGTYPIRPGEMVSDVIQRAGGLTIEAFPGAAVFTRETLREREQQQIDQMIRRLEADLATAATRQMDADAAQAQAMARSLVEQLRATRAAGRLVIDLPRLMRNPGDLDFDVLARAGDLLVVPKRPQEVTVLGEVYFPTSHIYDPDMRRADYVERSGGMTYRADSRRVYVVRANGAVEPVGGGRFRRGGARDIHPGDTIVVPVDAERVPGMVRLMNISQIMYQLGIAAAAWNTIGVF